MELNWRREIAIKDHTDVKVFVRYTVRQCLQKLVDVHGQLIYSCLNGCPHHVTQSCH